MVSRDKIAKILESYDKSSITIATACSHTSLQIFHGAKQEGFKTLGISVQQNTKFYDAFPSAKPDEFLYADSYSELIDRVDELVEKNAIVVPHGSFVEYMTPRSSRHGRSPPSAIGWCSSGRPTGRRSASG